MKLQFQLFHVNKRWSKGGRKKKKRRKRKGGRSSKFHCAWEVVSVYRANRGDPENRNKISICAPTRLLKRLRQCNERRGVKFDSTERRQKGGEGSLVPNVTRSENQPSNVSYIRIYIYTRATLRSPVPGRPRHIAAARLVYTNNRAFSANKKSSRRPVQSCCDNNCLVTRGVGSRGTTDVLSSLPRL